MTDTPTTPAASAAPSPTAAPASADYRGPEHTLNVQVSDHSAHTARERTVTSSDLAPKFSGLFADARTKTGMRATDITAETIIAVPRSDGRKIEMTVAAAERAGLVAKDEDVKYRETTTEERAPTEAQGTREEPATLPAEIEANVSQIVQGLQGSGFNHLNVVAEWLGKGDLTIPPEALGDVARKSGVPLEQIHAAWTDAVVAFSIQANEVFINEGLDPEQVWEWAERTVPRTTLNRARLHHYSRGDLRGWREIAKGFVAANGMGRGARIALGRPIPQGAKITTNSKGQQLITVGLPSGKTTQVRIETARALGWM